MNGVEGRANLPQEEWHSFYGPDDTGEQQRRVERAEGELDGVPLQFADGRDDEPEAHAAHALQQRQQHHAHDVAVARHLEHEDHEDEHQRRLAAHHHELRDDVREEDLARRHSGDPRTIQQALE